MASTIDTQPFLYISHGGSQPMLSPDFIKESGDRFGIQQIVLEHPSAKKPHHSLALPNCILNLPLSPPLPVEEEEDCGRYQSVSHGQSPIKVQDLCHHSSSE